MILLLVFSIITTVQPLHCGCYCCTHSFYRSGMARTLSKVVVVNKQLCPHLTVLYDGYKQVLHNTVARHEITLLLSQVLHIIALITHFQGFLVPGCVAAGYPQLQYIIITRSTSRHNTNGATQFIPHYRLPKRLRVIVTPAVYPRLVEFLHFDIQSTGQKSHCVNTISGLRNALF